MLTTTTTPDTVNGVGARLRAVRLAEAAQQSALRLQFAREVAAPLLARAFAAKRVWLFGSAATGQARTDSDVDLLVEGGEGLTAAQRLAKAYGLVTSLDVPCGCDVVVLTAAELAEKQQVSFIRTLLQERILVYGKQ